MKIKPFSDELNARYWCGYIISCMLGEDELLSCLDCWRGKEKQTCI